ncbi:hypothetical protein [Olivibacter oleidegradans]|uniref:Uncharacterized protein n=1 Tax=Olivibacter oleidegradans TaxID=760123 RepID=A0ABV6HPF5_9SPHI
MTKEIMLQLIELARLRTTWTYNQLNNRLELGLDFNNDYHRKRIREWLGEISIHEHSKRRPLLSSLIIHKNRKREQRDGFYKLCGEVFGEDRQSLKQDKAWEKQLNSKLLHVFRVIQKNIN